jgi:type III secretion system FlhB-like substrate exporter
MMHKGLSHYQSVQKNAVESKNRASLEKIMERAGLYNIAFLQNKALLETILALPDEEIDTAMMQKMQKLLLWLDQTQEEAKLS